MGIIIGFTALLGAVVVAVLIGRGGDDEGGDDSAGTETAAISSDLTIKPEPEGSDAPPPSTLVTDDVVEGDGAEAKSGDTVSVQYVGVDYVTGAEFDSSWSRGNEPFEFQLGAGMVIPGWDQGIVGMKEGGRRVLTIPSDLAYGPAGQPPDIGPDAALVFVVDLESVS